MKTTKFEARVGNEVKIELDAIKSQLGLTNTQLLELLLNRYKTVNTTGLKSGREAIEEEIKKQLEGEKPISMTSIYKATGRNKNVIKEILGAWNDAIAKHNTKF